MKPLQKLYDGQRKEDTVLRKRASRTEESERERERARKATEKGREREREFELEREIIFGNKTVRVFNNTRASTRRYCRRLGTQTSEKKAFKRVFPCQEKRSQCLNKLNSVTTAFQLYSKGLADWLVFGPGSFCNFEQY